MNQIFRMGSTTRTFLFLWLLATAREIQAQGPCANWCYNFEPVNFCDGWKNCAGCSECDSTTIPPVPEFCQNWCYNHPPQNFCDGWIYCAECPECDSITSPPTPSPGPPMFVDVTPDLFSDPTWYELGESYRPRNFEYGAAFPDWDGDGFLDYLDNSHISGIYADSWNFGRSIADPTTASGRKILNIAPFSIVQTDADKYFYDFDATDCHGMTFA